jgi:hypothetical protein
VPVQYSYISTPPMDRTACTEPQCLYSTAIPLLPLWAVRPLQSLSACTVQLYLYSPYGPYGLYKASVPVQGCTLLFLHQCIGKCNTNGGGESVRKSLLGNHAKVLSLSERIIFKLMLKKYGVRMWTGLRWFQMPLCLGLLLKW